MGEGEQGNSLPDREVAEGIGCTRRTVEQIRERCICEGLQAALERRVRFRERSRVLDGEGEARLVSLACMSHLKDNLAGLYGCWESDWWNWR